MNALNALFHNHPALCLAIIMVAYFFAALLVCALLGFRRSNCPTENPDQPPATPSILPENNPPAEVSAQCRARTFPYTNDFALCLTEETPTCVHRMKFGETLACFHPRRAEIIQQTTPQNKTDAK